MVKPFMQLKKNHKTNLFILMLSLMSVSSLSVYTEAAELKKPEVNLSLSDSKESVTIDVTQGLDKTELKKPTKDLVLTLDVEDKKLANEVSLVESLEVTSEKGTDYSQDTRIKKEATDNDKLTVTLSKDLVKELVAENNTSVTLKAAGTLADAAQINVTVDVKNNFSTDVAKGRLVMPTAMEPRDYVKWDQTVLFTTDYASELGGTGGFATMLDVNGEYEKGNLLKSVKGKRFVVLRYIYHDDIFKHVFIRDKSDPNNKLMPWPSAGDAGVTYWDEWRLIAEERTDLTKSSVKRPEDIELSIDGVGLLEGRPLKAVLTIPEYHEPRFKNPSDSTWNKPGEYGLYLINDASGKTSFKMRMGKQLPKDVDPTTNGGNFTFSVELFYADGDQEKVSTEDLVILIPTYKENPNPDSTFFMDSVGMSNAIVNTYRENPIAPGTKKKVPWELVYINKYAERPSVYEYRFIHEKEYPGPGGIPGVTVTSARFDFNFLYESSRVINGGIYTPSTTRSVSLFEKETNVLIPRGFSTPAVVDHPQTTGKNVKFSFKQALPAQPGDIHYQNLRLHFKIDGLSEAVDADTLRNNLKVVDEDDITSKGPKDYSSDKENIKLASVPDKPGEYVLTISKEFKKYFVKKEGMFYIPDKMLDIEFTAPIETKNKTIIEKYIDVNSGMVNLPITDVYNLDDDDFKMTVPEPNKTNATLKIDPPTGTAAPVQYVPYESTLNDLNATDFIANAQSMFEFDTFEGVFVETERKFTKLGLQDVPVRVKSIATGVLSEVITGKADVIQDPLLFVSVTPEIKLDRINDKLVTGKGTVSYTGGIDKEVTVETNPTLPLTSLEDNTAITNLNVFKDENTRLKLGEPLAILSKTNREHNFILKASPKDFKKVDIYEGVMDVKFKVN